MLVFSEYMKYTATYVLPNAPDNRRAKFAVFSLSDYRHTICRYCNDIFPRRNLINFLLRTTVRNCIRYVSVGMKRRNDSPRCLQINDILPFFHFCVAIVQ